MNPKANSINLSAFLVTGASGFIGRHLVSRLLIEYPEVRVVAQYRGDLPAAFDERVVPLKSELSELPVVLKRHASLPKWYSGVFHLAAFTPKSTKDDNAIKAVETNILGTYYLLQAVTGLTDRLVFTSAIDVYSPRSLNETILEDSPIAGQTLYAASKIFGETLVQKWRPGNMERVAIVRMGHIYGPGEDAYKKLIPETIRRLLSGQPALLFGNGDDLRDFLYVADAAEGLVFAWRALAHGDIGPVNLVSGQSLTVRDVIGIICEAASAPGFIEQRPGTALPRSLRFDASRAKKEIGFRAKTPFQEGIRSEIEWFRKKGSS